MKERILVFLCQPLRISTLLQLIGIVSNKTFLPELNVALVVAVAAAEDPAVGGWALGGSVKRVGSFLAAAEVSDCRTESGRSIPRREASVAN